MTIASDFSVLYDGVPFLILPDGVAISVGSGVEETAKVLTAQFGNNYAQRAVDGLNNISGSYTLTIENLTRDEAVLIIRFFKDMGGAKGFLFTPPGETAERLWRCEKWSRTHADSRFDNVTATLIEVFAP